MAPIHENVGGGGKDFFFDFFLIKMQKKEQHLANIPKTGGSGEVAAWQNR